MLDVSKISIGGKIIFIAVLSIVFVLVAVPFKVLNIIPGFTEIRPVNCLNMLFGIMFGVYGALGCAIGNLIADILGGTLAISSWAGFVSNFLGTYLAYLLWYAIVNEKPSINNFKQVIAFIFISAFIGIVIAGVVTFGVKLSYDEIDGFFLFMHIFLNTVGFSVILGMPLTIMLDSAYGIIGVIPEKYAKEVEDD